MRADRLEGCGGETAAWEARPLGGRRSGGCGSLAPGGYAAEPDVKAVGEAWTTLSRERCRNARSPGRRLLRRSCVAPASSRSKTRWEDVWRPRGRPCDRLVTADQVRQDDPLTAHRPARRLLSRIFFLFSERRGSGSAREPARGS